MKELNAWKSNAFIQGIECPICGFSMYGTEIHTMDDWRFCPKCGTRLYGNFPEFEEPTYEDLPIDLYDDDYCDYCDKPDKWGCVGTQKCHEDYPLFECCADNLEDRVGEMCFDNNLPSKLAKDIIDLIKKERERNESLYLFGKHFQD